MSRPLSITTEDTTIDVSYQEVVHLAHEDETNIQGLQNFKTQAAKNFQNMKSRDNNDLEEKISRIVTKYPC